MAPVNRRWLEHLRANGLGPTYVLAAGHDIIGWHVVERPRSRMILDHLEQAANAPPRPVAPEAWPIRPKDHPPRTKRGLGRADDP